MEERRYEREPVDPVVIEAHADRLLVEPGDNKDRLIRVLTRLYERAGLSIDFKLPEIRDVYEAQWSSVTAVPDIDQAIHLLGLERALTLFETCDLDRLSDLCSFSNYICDPDTPICSLSEMSDHLTKITAHLRRDREHLVRTGYPQRSLPVPHWLSLRLGNLYPTKQPMMIEVPSDDSVDIAYTYSRPTAETWASGMPQDAKRTPSSCPLDVYVSGDKFYLENGAVEEFVDYELAPFSWGFSAGDAQTLEDLRTKVLDAKIAIVAALAEASKTQNAEGLQERCLSILEDAFTGEEIETLLAADEQCTGYRMRSTGEHDEITGLLPTGGVTDMLTLLWHVKKEIEVGTFHRIWEELRVPRPSGATPGDQSPSSSDYFQHVESEHADAISGALEVLLSSRDSEKDSLDRFRKDVNYAIEQDFSDEVPLTARVPRKHRAQIEPRLKEFVTSEELRLRKTEIPQEILPAECPAEAQPASLPAATDSEDFEHNDDYTVVKLRGTEHLLSKQRARAIQILHLAHRSGKPNVPGAQLLADMGELAPSKITDVFRSDSPHRELIDLKRKRGFYRLNI